MKMHHPLSGQGARTLFSDPFSENPFFSLEPRMLRTGNRAPAGMRRHEEQASHVRGLGAPRFVPWVEWRETDEVYTIHAELPGVSASQIEASVRADGTLHILGVRKSPASPKTRFIVREQGTGPFERTISLPGDADIERVETSLRNGILEIRIPRRQSGPGRPRRVPVRAD